MHGIVVRVDGTEHAAGALRWAVDEGQTTGRPVTAVLAWETLDQHQSDGSQRLVPGYGQEDAGTALATIVERALGTDATDVGRIAVRGQAARSLLDAARHADMLVVGARRSGEAGQTVVGSVSQQCMHHSSSPLVVVHGAPLGSGRIVVGVDGSDQSLVALRWAVEEARRRNAAVDVVHAWRGDGRAVGPAASVFAREAREALDRCMARLGPDAGVPIEPVLVEGGPATAILDRAREADLIVVETRGSGEFTGLLVGSAAHHVTYGASCAVVLVPSSGRL